MPKKLTARNRAFANAQLRRMAENAAVTAPARSNSDPVRKAVEAAIAVSERVAAAAEAAASASSEASSSAEALVSLVREEATALGAVVSQTNAVAKRVAIEQNYAARRTAKLAASAARLAAKKKRTTKIARQENARLRAVGGTNWQIAKARREIGVAADANVAPRG
jgi:hypothetical protein